MNIDDIKLSVIIPCYNERDTIRDIITIVNASPLNKEVIVVDDYSTDGTREILASEIIYKVDKVIFHEHNQGKGAAVRSGISVVTGDIVIIQDADLEYNPLEYTKLIRPIIDGIADVVYGSRFLMGNAHKVLGYRHAMINGFLTFVSNLFTNIYLTDMETCYKVFRKEIVQSIKIEENRFGFDSEITAKISKMKCRIYEIGVDYFARNREQGKKIKWHDGFRALWCILKYNLRRKWNASY